MVGSQLRSHLVGAQVLGVANQAESSDIGAAARAVPDVALGRRTNDNNCERIAVQAREKEVKCDDNVD